MKKENILKFSKSLKYLMTILNYEFKNTALLELALTHRSVETNNNERLEFLGDSILNFIIAHALFQQFPNLPEGDLSRLRSNLVNQETLALLAGEMNIGNYIKLGPGELKSGGVRRKSILSDTVEAIIGAIYLDGGMINCEKNVIRWFDSRLKMIKAYKINTHALKDPKSRLQEYLQGAKMALPVYTVVSIKGQAHDQLFQVKCEVPDISYSSEGIAASRREAEQIGAEIFLKWLNLKV